MKAFTMLVEYPEYEGSRSPAMTSELKVFADSEEEGVVAAKEELANSWRKREYITVLKVRPGAVFMPFRCNFYGRGH